MPAAYISHRLSIRWVPEEASEPTNTVVLTGARTGTFLDVRFFKEAPKTLDWAFAGYRYIDPGLLRAFGSPEVPLFCAYEVLSLPQIRQTSSGLDIISIPGQQYARDYPLASIKHLNINNYNRIK